MSKWNYCEGLCPVLATSKTWPLLLQSGERDRLSDHDVVSTIIKVYAKCYELSNDGTITTFKNF